MENGGKYSVLERVSTCGVGVVALAFGIHRLQEEMTWLEEWPRKRGGICDRLLPQIAGGDVATNNKSRRNSI